MNMRCPNRTDQLFLCKILCIGPGTKIRTANINCLRPGSDRSFESLIRTCR